MNNIQTRLYTTLSVIALLALGSVAHAQPSSCNAFILGKYIELGVNWNGAFGASTPPPSGSHSNASASLYNKSVCGGGLYTGTSLGMVADAERTGWSSYFGDFVLPGGAKEGWSILFDGTQKNAWNSDAAVTDSIINMPSYIYSYTDTLGIKEIKTQSIYQGLYTTQWITLDTTKLFFTMQVLLENTTLAVMQDMYYMRSINPHNDQMISGNPNTWNKIDYQFPDTATRTMVSAKGTVLNTAYLAMGTKDIRATGFVTRNSQLTTTTLDNIASGDPSVTIALNDSLNSNSSMGIVYNIGPLVSGGSALLNFFYAFRPDAVDEAFHQSGIVGVSNLNTTVPHYHIYPNPMQDNFRLLGVTDGDEVALYDMVGRKLSCTRNAPNEYGIANIAPGTYLVVIKDKNGMIKGRVPVQKN